MRRQLTHLARGARDERGIALPFALGTMVVMTFAMITVIELTSSSSRSSERTSSDARAVSLSEAGVNYALSLLGGAADPSVSTALPSSGSPGTMPSTEAGTVTYWGTLSGSTWTISARSSVPGPSGSGAVTRTVSMQASVSPPAGTLAGNEAWNYVFSNSSSCTYVDNAVEIRAPMYTKGDLCIKNTATVLGSNVDVYGGIQRENNASIGTSPDDATDPAVRTRLGCRNGSSGGFNLACASATYNVYRSSYGNTVPSITKPPIAGTTRASAKPGPLQACTTSSGSVPSFASTGAVDLMPGSSYTCEVWVSGTMVGRLSWNNSTKVLSIKGTIWFDGELILDNSQGGTYDGQATIYFARKINIQNSAWLCAMPACATSGWDPNSDLLVLASAASDTPAFEIQNSAKFQGAAYVAGGFKLQNSAQMQGPVVAEQLDIMNSGITAGWTGLTSLLSGMPQNPSTATPTVAYVPGSWRG